MKHLRQQDEIQYYRQFFKSKSIKRAKKLKERVDKLGGYIFIAPWLTGHAKCDEVIAVICSDYVLYPVFNDGLYTGENLKFDRMEQAKAFCDIVGCRLVVEYQERKNE